ncbi:MAG TPA: hypothetical protein VGO07_03395 [Candidatus Saccharimonadales bacterium]|jgi:hypothetical protein|nr:hypothetical protein [Candidatus Saccharimonadales bacterium]
MTKEAQVTIIGSNLNLTPKEAATWGVAQHKAAITKAGYDGMAYYPVRGRMALEMALGADTEGFIRAIHQPWREATTAQIAAIAFRGAHMLRKNPTDGKAALFEAAMNAGMPRLEGSDGKIARLVARVGGSAVPAVVHPYGQLLGDGGIRKGATAHGPKRDYHDLAADPRTGELQWQPSADFAANRRVLSKNAATTAAGMADNARGDGLGRAAFDTNHALMLRRDRWQFSDPAALAAWFAANNELGVLEFSLQPRFGSKVSDLDKILDGRIAETPHGEMLAAAASNTPPGQDFNIKVEIPDYAFTGDATQRLGLGMDSAHTGHQLLVPILHDYAVNNLPAAA